MTFSARSAILSDDEEWFNIPPVVRNFLRQLNNEVHGNRLSLDNLLTNHQEQDMTIKNCLSKQMERDAELNKTIFVFQQDREEGENSMRNVVDSLRDQLRRFNEDQCEIRDRVRQLEEKEGERTANNGSLQSKFVSLSKTVNQRLGQVEKDLQSTSDNFTQIVEKLDTETQLQFQKHNKMMKESRSDIERVNEALHQLCDAVSEDVDNLRIRLQDHECFLQEIKEVDDTKNESQVNIISRMRDKLKETETIVRHLENSSEDRFESVFGTLEKTQSLIDKLSKAYERQTEEHSSILKVLNETRQVQTTFSEEVLASFQEKVKKHDTQLDVLNKRLIEMHATNDAIEERLNKKCSEVRSDFEGIYNQLEKMDLNFSNTVLKDDLNRSFSDMFSYEKKLIEKACSDHHSSITRTQDIIREEVNCVKETLSNLETKFDKKLSSTDDLEPVRTITRMAVEKQKVVEREIDYVREEMKKMRDTFSQQISELIGESKNSVSGSVLTTAKVEVEELKTSFDRTKCLIDTQGVQLNEIQQKIIHHDALVNDIPKRFQRYLQDVDDKLSPILLELDVLRKRITSHEVGSFLTQSPEPRTAFSHAREDLEDVKITVRNNHLLHTTQRQLQSTEVRLDNLHTLNQSLERKIGLFSKELSDVTEVLTSLHERDNQKDILMRNELNKVTAQVSKIEVDLKQVSETSDLRTKTPNIPSDVKHIDSSLDAIRAQISKLEEKVFVCVTFSSEEWIGLQQELDRLRRKFQERIEYSETSQANKSLELASLPRDLPNEETVSLVRKEIDRLQDTLKNCAKMMESNNESSQESEVMRSLERRLCHLESMRAEYAEPLFLSRVNSIEKALGETQGKVSALSIMPEKIDFFTSRLSVVEKQIKENDCSSTSGVAFPALLDRLAGVEGAMGTLSRDTEKFSVDLLSYQKRIEHLEEKYSHHEVNEIEGFDSRGEETLKSDKRNNSISLKAQERFKEIESDISSLRGSLSDRLESFYTKVQMDARFENIWASFIGLLARKADQETIDQRLSDLRQLVTDDVSIQINGVARDLQRAIDERVKVSEVRELLRST